jgi:hypothetical protein
VNMSRVEKLVMEVEPLVGVGELVRSAFLVQRGASPGMEGVASAFAGVLGMFAVMGSRRWYTFVVTDRNVYLLKNRPNECACGGRNGSSVRESRRRYGIGRLST